MDYISAIGNGMQVKQYQDVVDTVAKGAQTRTTQTDSFENLFRSAFNMVRETNSLTNMAQEEAMNFAMGYTDNMHDLLTAQWKANMSLQYTVAVRKSVVDAYKEIMNLQF